MTARVLVVDDDETIRRTLRINLRARGYEVEVVGDGRSALDAHAAQPPDVAILDLGLPDLDGIEVLRRIRETHATPVIVLSARHESDDKVEALDEGADDYVTKPFGMDELMARVRAAQRRGADTPPGTAPVETADFRLDFDRHLAHVRRAGTPGWEAIHLTPTEWRILACLATNRGIVVPHQTILRSAWGPAYGRESNYLRVYANQLRRKLEPEPGAPRYLRTEPGIGYVLDVD